MSCVYIYNLMQTLSHICKHGLPFLFLSLSIYTMYDDHNGLHYFQWITGFTLWLHIGQEEHPPNRSVQHKHGLNPGNHMVLVFECVWVVILFEIK